MANTPGAGGLLCFDTYVWFLECFSPEADPAEKKVCPRMEEHKTAFQKLLKQDPVRVFSDRETELVWLSSDKLQEGGDRPFQWCCRCSLAVTTL